MANSSLCRPWLTAKSIRPLPSAIVGKLTKWSAARKHRWLPCGFFAIRGGQQRAHCRWRWTAKSLHCLFFSVFSYTQPFSQQIDDTYIFFTWQVHNKHMRYPTHIISSYMHSSINHTYQVPHTCIQPYILQ